MAAAKIRRRRIVIAAASGLAAGSFAFGAAVGDVSAPQPSVASSLTLNQLAGQRIVAGPVWKGITAANLRDVGVNVAR